MGLEDDIPSLFVCDVIDLVPDIPEEFMDVITGDLMIKPVKMSSSRQVVDESTLVMQHLISGEDPFTRQELEMSPPVQDENLKSRIKLWISSINN